MSTAFLKTPSFWIAMVMANLGILLTNGFLGTGDAAVYGGWALNLLTVLGYKALAPKAPEAPPAA